MSTKMQGKEKRHTNNLWNDMTRIFNFVPTSVARFDIYSHILAAIELKCPIKWATVLAYCAIFFVYFFDHVVLISLRGHVELVPLSS
jgi:hypothetical protein